MALHPNDKRNWHGALAKHSPFALGGVFCLACLKPIWSTVELAAHGPICWACRDAGRRTPEESAARPK